MHVEPIESRRLMAADVLDPSFGNAGTVTLPAGVTADIAVLGTTDAVYVTARDDTTTYLYKFGHDGAPAADWGDAGRVAITIRPQVLAYDQRTDTLYAAGVYERVSQTVNSVEVVRFAADGAIDAGYGTAGVARYTPTVGPGVSAFEEVSQIRPLTHGRVLVGFRSQISTQTGAGGDLDVDGGREISLLQLRDNGTRDPAFGRRGVRTYFGGPFGEDEIADATVTRYDVPLLTDVQPLADGGFRLVATRFRGTQAFGPGRPDDGDRTSEAFAEARIIDAAGRVNPQQDYVWSLGRTTPADRVGDDPHELRPLIALNDGAGDVNAIAIRDRQSPVLYQLSTVNPAVTRPVALPKNAVTDVPPYAVDVLAFRRGYFVVNGQKGVVKLRADLRVDRAFADTGTLNLDPTGTNDAYRLAPDADGRLLVVSDDAVRRFAREA